MSKTLVVLGGADKSVPLVRAAKERGHRVVLCDRDESSPCRAHADIFAQVSTLDEAAVTAVARKHAADGIVAFGSDVMALAAARVAARLDLPGNPVATVETMVRKDLFRMFLHDHGFPVPAMRAACAIEEHDWPAAGLAPPVIVKPVDGAGSTAVARIDDWALLPQAFATACAASRSGRVIVEEFIERTHPNLIAGDIFVIDGKVAYYGLIDSHRAARGARHLPTGTSFPPSLDASTMARVRAEIAALVNALGFVFGPVNVELMMGADGRIHAIELAPRNGGNAIPDLLALAEGVDLVGALVDATLGEPPRLFPRGMQTSSGCHTNYMIHSPVAGRFAALDLAHEVRPYVTRITLDVMPGDLVAAFDRAPAAIGTLWLRFDDPATQQTVAQRLPDLARVELA